MIAFLTTVAHFLRGTYAKFGTSSNLFREIIVSVLTAVVVAVLAQFFTPAIETPAAELTTAWTSMLKAQRNADSTLALVKAWKYQHTIDSLKTVLLDRDEQDSLRSNADLSDLDAMHQLNRTIDADRKRTHQ